LVAALAQPTATTVLAAVWKLGTLLAAAWWPETLPAAP
jgi:hypothetical protein